MPTRDAFDEEWPSPDALPSGWVIADRYEVLDRLYDGFIVAIDKRFRKRYQVRANYT